MLEPRADATLVTATTGLTIRYRDWGGEGSSVVLLHGLASSSRIFDLCAPILARAHRVVAYDERGHGDSDKPDDGYDIDTFIADGVGVVDALKLPKPITVVGHSWGAAVALGWAVRRPDEVRSAVLVDGAIFSLADMFGHHWDLASARLAPPDLSGLTLDDLLERTRHGSLDFLTEEVRRTYFTSIMHRLEDGTIRARLTRDNHLKILRALYDEDLERAYRALRRPTLAVVAAHGDVADEEQHQLTAAKRISAARMMEIQPLLEVRVLENTVHDIPLQRPETLAEAIAGFAT